MCVGGCPSSEELDPGHPAAQPPATVAFFEDAGTLRTPSGESSVSVTTEDGRRFDVHYESAQPDVQPGDIFVSTAGRGHLRRVESVRVDTAAQTLTLTTSQATLAEAVGNGVIESRVHLTPETATVLEGGAAKTRQRAQPLGGELVFDGIVLVDHPNLNVTLGRGSLDFGLDFTLNLEFADLALERAVIGAEGSLDLQIEAEATGAITGDFHPDPIPVGSPLVWGPFIQPLPFPPFALVEVVVMDLVAGVEADGGITGTATAGVHGSTDVFAGLEYTPADGTRPLATITTSFDPIGPDFELDGEAELRVFIRPEVTVLLYGVVGPYLNASPYGEFSGSFDLCGWQAELNAGLTSDVGLQVVILDWRLVDIGPFRVLDWRTDPPLWELGDSLPTLTVTVTPAGAGSVSISPNKPCYAPGEGVTLTAQAAPGFTFDRWSGVDSAAGTVARVTMNDSRSVTAAFSAESPENQPPVAESQTVSVAYETPTQITLRANDPDGGPSELTFSIVDAPLHGSLSPVAGNRVTYTPHAGYSGPDRFTFRAYDGEDFSNEAEISIGVGSPPQSIGNLLVVSDGTKSVIQYDAESGACIGTFTRGGKLDKPHGLTFGPNGNLFVANARDQHDPDDPTDQNIVEYDGVTGEFIREFVPPGCGGLEDPRGGLTFGPNGNLFVSSSTVPYGEEGSILEYDGETGAFVGPFVPAGSGGLDGPRGLTFGPNNNLFVCSFYSNCVIEYDGTTGEFVRVFTSEGWLWGPQDLILGPNGNLFVAAQGSHSVIEYDGSSGEFVRDFVPWGSGGLHWPFGLTFGANGNLFVTSVSPHRVIEYDGSTGELIGTFVEDESCGLSFPRQLTFMPTP